MHPLLLSSITSCEDYDNTPFCLQQLLTALTLSKMPSNPQPYQPKKVYNTFQEISLTTMGTPVLVLFSVCKWKMGSKVLRAIDSVPKPSVDLLPFLGVREISLLLS